MKISAYIRVFAAIIFFGIISMILNIVWGYSSNTPEPKRSFCRAMLIFNIVGYVLAIFGSVLFFSIFGDEFSIIFNRLP